MFIYNQTQQNSNQYFIGIAWMLVASVFVALSSLLGKQLVLSLALPIVILLRYLFPALILWIYALMTNLPSFNKKHFMHFGMRSLLGLLSQYALLYYLTYGSILDGTLLLMTSPLFVPLILRITQKTAIQAKQWFSVVLGFIGVIFILKPNHNILDWHAVIGLTSGLFNAGSQVYFHKIIKQSGVKGATLYMFTFSTLLALVPAIIFWHPLFHAIFSLQIHTPDSNLILLFIGLALVNISNKTCRGRAYSKVSKASSLTPFLYMAIIFAGLLDWMVYNIVPDYSSIAGAVLIILSGFVLYTNKSENTVTGI